MFFQILTKIISFFNRTYLRGIQPLAVGDINSQPTILAYQLQRQQLLLIPHHKNLFFRTSHQKILTIKDSKEVTEDISLCHGFSVWQEGGRYFISYVRSKKGKSYFVVAESSSLDMFYITRCHAISGHYGLMVNIDAERNRPAFYVENKTHGVSVYTAKNKRSLELQDTHALEPRSSHFDHDSIALISALKTNSGIFLVYDASFVDNGETIIQIGAATYSPHQPWFAMWRSDSPLFEKRVLYSEYGDVTPLGLTVNEDTYTVFYTSSRQGIFSLSFTNPLIKTHAQSEHLHTCDRHCDNPLLEPASHAHWENMATFNPAVWKDGDHTYLLYRAIGNDGVSRLGYAVVKDGAVVERLPYPVFQILNNKSRDKGYDPVLYPSGGSWGGVEDPRMVEIEGRLYLTATVFDSWDCIRMAVMSISTEDFRNKKFKWSDPVYLSPPGQIQKNWLLFPDKINGKFAIFHGLNAKTSRRQARIEYFDSLDEPPEEFLHSPNDFRHELDTTSWDSYVRGAGPPPVKTRDGWLVFYHATDKREMHRYKLGAMLLDLNDPSRVLYRSKYPVLEPDEWYENAGKPGVVYATGAIIDGDLITLYYGGGDTVVCSASISLEALIESLKKGTRIIGIQSVTIY